MAQSSFLERPVLSAAVRSANRRLLNGGQIRVSGSDRAHLLGPSFPLLLLCPFLSLLLLLLVASSLPSSSAQSQDTKTLLEIKDYFYSVSTVPEINQTFATWTKGTDPCPTSNPTWERISCDGENVVYLNLTNAFLEGSIPTVMSSLAYLTYLGLAKNGITGPIPDALSNLKNLQSLLLNSNPIGGEIPTVLTTFSKLNVLRFSGCGVSGPFPSFLTALSSLQALDLSGNALSGDLPDLSTMTGLTWLSLNVNEFSGELPAWVGQLPALKILGLRDNNFNGTIPDFSASTSLQRLYLSVNSLTGPLPDSLSTLTRLELLYASQNQLQGSVPDTFSSLTSLKQLDLSYNTGLQGPLPSSLGKLAALEFMSFAGCQLAGSIPDTLSSLTALKGLYLSSCQLSGPIPASLGSMSTLEQMLLAKNQLNGTIPDSLCSLSQLETLDVSFNSLSGEIPPCVGQMQSLRTFSVANNMLTGSVPPGLASSLTNLQFMYSGNCLSGVEGQNIFCTPGAKSVLWPLLGVGLALILVAAAVALFCIIRRRMSNRGPIVVGGSMSTPQGATQNWSFLSAPGWTRKREGSVNSTSALNQGASSSWSYPTLPTMKWPAHWKVTMPTVQWPVWRSAGGGAAATSGGGGGGLPSVNAQGTPSAISSTSMNRAWDSVAMMKDTTEFTLAEIEQATRSFTALQGRETFGTVYTGVGLLGGQGRYKVIVKRATNPSVLELTDIAFKDKVALLAAARHPYIHTLLGYCLKGGERILVYEFVSNSTLVQHLHNMDQGPIPWSIRVKIAASLACALDFLHHTMSLAHGDVSSERILLGPDLTAKLVDLGLSRGCTRGLLPFKKSKSRVSSRQRRSQRLAEKKDDEFGKTTSGEGEETADGASMEGASDASSGSAEKGDVYAFGVVLLELITGQKVMQDVHITTIAAPFLDDPNVTSLMVDPQVGSSYSNSELMVLANIARSCIEEDPTQRPTMKDVVRRMKDQMFLDPSIFEPYQETSSSSSQSVASTRGDYFTGATAVQRQHRGFYSMDPEQDPRSHPGYAGTSQGGAQSGGGKGFGGFSGWGSKGQTGGAEGGVTPGSLL